VNEVWCRTCGFDAEEVLGQTCKILHGPGTCGATLNMLKQALHHKRHLAVQLLNYTKAGTPFMNTLQVAPLYGVNGQVTHYLGIIMARFLDGGAAVPPVEQQLNRPAAIPPPISHRSLDSDMMGTRLALTHHSERSGEEEEYSPLHDADGMNDTDDGYDDPSGGGARVPPFLTKLTEILTAETAQVVTLNPETASFTVWDPTRFAKEVLPRYFKHNKLGSFSQQLHTYGFRRRTSSGSLDSAIEFYHEQYTGDPSEFLAWIRAGGAVSKRTSHTRQPPASQPPPQLLADLWQVHEGMKQLALTLQQIKSAHAAQIRTILTKLMLRGLLTPESASYLSALPPATPLGQHPPVMPGMQHPGGWDPSAHNRSISSLTEDGLQAQLDALEAGLPPLMGQPFGQMGENNDFQGEEALQMYVDSAPGGGLMHGMPLMKDLRQQPYPVDVISNLLNRDRVSQPT